MERTAQAFEQDLHMWDYLRVMTHCVIMEAPLTYTTVNQIINQFLVDQILNQILNQTFVDRAGVLERPAK